MAKLIVIFDIDRDPLTNDPHEVAADVLYHYEQHREVNQDDPELTFVDAKWADALLAERLTFTNTSSGIHAEVTMPEPEQAEIYENGEWRKAEPGEVEGHHPDIAHDGNGGE